MSEWAVINGILGAVTAFVVSLGVYLLIDAGPSCKRTWPDHEVKWVIRAGCMVKIDGKWINERYIKVNP